MALSTRYETYRQSHYEGMDPKRLILMLYDGALQHIRLAREAIQTGNVQKRGESLSKVIAIVSELNASLDSRYQDEPIRFLRGLYAAILTEMPKVSLTNDITILDRTEAYVEQLKTIWTSTVMKAKAADQPEPPAIDGTDTIDPQPQAPANASRKSLYRNPGTACYGQRSISV